MVAAVCHICCVTEDFFLPPQCHISAGHWLFTTPTSHRRRQMLLAEQTPGSLPGVWRAAHCPAWRNTPCTSTEWPILWWYPRQHRHKASFPEIPSGKCNDKIGFIYLFTYLPILPIYSNYTLCLVTADVKRPVLQGSIPSAVPWQGRADPSQQQIPSLSRGDANDNVFPQVSTDSRQYPVP